jgi:hypothetical protein
MVKKMRLAAFRIEVEYDNPAFHISLLANQLFSACSYFPMAIYKKKYSTTQVSKVFESRLKSESPRLRLSV